MSFLTDPDRLEPSYKDTYEKWKTSPTPQTTGALLTAIQPDINKGITAHVGKQVSPMTRSRARRMALQAIQSYDPTKAKLGTHVINQLQGLRRVVRRQTQVLRTPERVAIDQNRVRLAKQELLDETGRDPSMAELADHTGLSIRRLQHIRKFKHPTAEGTFSSMPGEEGEESFMPSVQRPGEPDPWIEVVYSDLDSVNQKILEWSIGLHGEPRLSNKAIANKLRVSPGAISQRKQKIQSMLDEGERRSPF